MARGQAGVTHTRALGEPCQFLAGKCLCRKARHELFVFFGGNLIKEHRLFSHFKQGIKTVVDEKTKAEVFKVGNARKRHGNGVHSFSFQNENKSEPNESARLAFVPSNYLTILYFVP